MRFPFSQTCAQVTNSKIRVMGQDTLSMDAKQIKDEEKFALVIGHYKWMLIAETIYT